MVMITVPKWGPSANPHWSLPISSEKKDAKDAILCIMLKNRRWCCIMALITFEHTSRTNSRILSSSTWLMSKNSKLILFKFNRLPLNIFFWPFTSPLNWFLSIRKGFSKHLRQFDYKKCSFKKDPSSPYLSMCWDELTSNKVMNVFQWKAKIDVKVTGLALTGLALGRTLSYATCDWE